MCRRRRVETTNERTNAFVRPIFDESKVYWKKRHSPIPLKTLNIELLFLPPTKKKRGRENILLLFPREKYQLCVFVIRRRKMLKTKGRRRQRRRRSGRKTPPTLAKKVARVGAAAVLVAGVVSRLEVAVAEYQCPSFGERIFFLYAKRLLLFCVFNERETLFRVLIDPRSFEKQIPRGWKNWPRSVWKTRTGCAATCA